MIRRTYDGIYPQPKKVYLAASFSRQEEMQNVARDLRATGVNVIARWLDEDRSVKNHTPDALNGLALIDIEDIMSCDVFVRFSDDLGLPLVYSQLATGARHFEMGLAWATFKDIIVVGGHQQLFDYLASIVHLPDTESLINHFSEKIQ
jgi:hypothetical protein